MAIFIEGFPGDSVVKNPPDYTGEEISLSSIPGPGRSLEEGMATHSSNLAWKFPWTEESGRSQRVIHDWACTHNY